MILTGTYALRLVLFSSSFDMVFEMKRYSYTYKSNLVAFRRFIILMLFFSLQTSSIIWKLIHLHKYMLERKNKRKTYYMSGCTHYNSCLVLLVRQGGLGNLVFVLVIFLLASLNKLLRLRLYYLFGFPLLFMRRLLYWTLVFMLQHFSSNFH